MLTSSWEATARDEWVRAVRSESFVVRVLHSPDAGAPREIVLGRAPIELGRAPTSEPALAIHDPRLSRSHALLSVDEHGVRLLDQSTHGTFVRGERVAEARVGDGDVLRVGDTFLLVRAVPDATRDAPLDALVGRAPCIAVVREAIERVARTSSSVVLTGEPGSGKSLAARALHERSGRPGRFVVVRCAEVSVSQIDAYLFGSAARGSAGALRDAHRGTLYLDGLAQLPLETQGALLRAIETRAVTAVGGDRSVPCDVRVVASAEGELSREPTVVRDDLWARLAQVVIGMPTLRERREDVLSILARALGDCAPPLAPDLVETLLAHDWPGNGRELRAIARELQVRGAASARLEAEMVRDLLAVDARTRRDVISSWPPARPRGDVPTREQIERHWRESEGNVSELARRMGRSRRQVRRYLAAVGLRTGHEDEELTSAT